MPEPSAPAPRVRVGAIYRDRRGNEQTVAGWVDDEKTRVWAISGEHYFVDGRSTRPRSPWEWCLDLEQRCGAEPPDGYEVAWEPTSVHGPRAWIFRRPDGRIGGNFNTHGRALNAAYRDERTRR